jgi:hypothetical protein
VIGPGRSLLALAALMLGLACRPEIRRAGSESLAGYSARMPLEGDLRLELSGTVDDSPARILLEVASPLSTVTTGCFLRSGNPRSRGRVRLPQLDGSWLELPEVVVSGARLGPIRLEDRLAGLLTADGQCVFTLGSDALGPFALEIDPERRQVTLTSTRPRQAYLGEADSSTSANSVEERSLLPLARDPKSDWPLLTARILQDTTDAAVTFALSTAAEQSAISESAAREAGLKPPSRPARFRLDELQLSPGLGVHQVALEGRSKWSNQAAIGVLGSDVWGHFRVTLDVQAGVLILRRPRLVKTRGRQLCADEEGQSSEERCFALHALKLGDGLAALATVWRELPEGARLHLDPIEKSGRSIASDCRFGLTFSPSDRGTSTAQQFPWPAMERTFPACAGAIRQAEGFALALFEEGSLEQCPGQCAFVRHLRSGRLSCQCVDNPAGRVDRATALETYRRTLEKRNARPRATDEPEPSPE